MLSYQEVLKIYSDDSFFLYLELSITVLEEKKFYVEWNKPQTSLTQPTK